ncbi:MAG TPA: hypothetical protein VGY58_15670 [Gemmataceae bacterium]|nr:hypothetical protein [Gemmataceae bacterium]
MSAASPRPSPAPLQPKRKSKPASPATPAGRPAPPFEPSVNGGTPAPPFKPFANGAGSVPPTEAAVASAATSRDALGRFAKGNRGGPGNPFARRLAMLRRTLLSHVNEDDIQNAARRLTEEARRGDLAAIKLLFAYVIGRPVDAVDPDTVDQQELDLYRQGQARMADILGILSNLPPGMACHIVRQVLPYAAEDVARGLLRFLELQAPGAMDKACVTDPPVPDPVPDLSPQHE